MGEKFYGFHIQDNRLQIGGQPISEYLNEHKLNTPIYLYRSEQIRTQIAELRQQLPQEIALHYAVKANPYPPLLKLMTDLVDGFDIASVGEMETLLHSGAIPEQISFASPGKGINELRRAISLGVQLNVESKTELDRITQLARELGKKAPIALRINPDFLLKGSGMRMGGGPSPFGIDAEVIPDILSQIDHNVIDMRGFHLYAGSQVLDAEMIIQAQQQGVELILRLAKGCPQSIRYINLGGGFGIPYFAHQQGLDIRPIGTTLKQLHHQIKKEHPDAQIVIELGRYLVGEAGIYLCRIIDIKVSRGTSYLICDGGMHQHLAAAGLLGQVIRKNYPITLVDKAHFQGSQKFNISGPLCTPLDTLGQGVELDSPEIGGIIAIMQSGAYGYSASPLNFLSHPPPDQILI